jgi:retinol-binding protein 3
MRASAPLIGIAAILLLAVLPTRTVDATAVVIPDTPAGGVLKAWLDAIDSGDRARIAAYCAKYGNDNDDPDYWLDFFRQSGGVDLVSVEKSERLHIAFRVKDRGTPITGYGKLDVSGGATPRVVSFGLRAIPPGLTAADMDIPVDAATRKRVLDGVAAKLDEFYVYPELAKKMIAAVTAHRKQGEYDTITDSDVFAWTLTKHLRAVSHDKHLRVGWFPEVLPKEDPKQDEQPDAEMRAQLERDNCGFERVERLQSNIGYVKLNFFGPSSVCGPTASAAMSFLAHVDAIIFDLRDNHGGEPEMVAYVLSYLFDTRTHLNDIYDRKENKTTQMWTRPDVPGKKLSGKPAFVLTSKRTFSGGEDFAYTLKSLKRATVVGETTGGGAHPTLSTRLDDHFLIGVPRARSINPITKTNWEGVGVSPDIAVPAEDALTTATKLALEALAKVAKPR